MKTPVIELPAVVTRAEWLAARLELLTKEKELTRRRDALNAERRRLPMVRIEKDYVFEGPNGKPARIWLLQFVGSRVPAHPLVPSCRFNPPHAAQMFETRDSS